MCLKAMDSLELNRLSNTYLYSNSLTKEQKHLFSKLRSSIEHLIDIYIIEDKYSEERAKELLLDNLKKYL